MNLSCNFFCGKFDLKNYIQFLHNYWIHLEKLEKTIVTDHPSTLSEVVGVSGAGGVNGGTGNNNSSDESTKKYKRNLSNKMD